LTQYDLSCNCPILVNSNIAHKCAFQCDLKILSDRPKFAHGYYHWYKEQGQPRGADNSLRFGIWTTLGRTYTYWLVRVLLLCAPKQALTTYRDFTSRTRSRTILTRCEHHRRSAATMRKRRAPVGGRLAPPRPLGSETTLTMRKRRAPVGGRLAAHWLGDYSNDEERRAPVGGRLAPPRHLGSETTLRHGMSGRQPTLELEVNGGVAAVGPQAQAAATQTRCTKW